MYAWQWVLLPAYGKGTEHVRVFCRGRLTREGSVELDIPDMFPASPSIRQQRSRRKRSEYGSAPRYLHYDASERLRPPMLWKLLAPLPMAGCYGQMRVAALFAHGSLEALAAKSGEQWLRHGMAWLCRRGQRHDDERAAV